VRPEGNFGERHLEMYPATTQFDTRIRELVEEIAEIKATLDELSERTRSCDEGEPRLAGVPVLCT
jgi:hypothetical protein